jgi:hypothetical protein
MAARGLYGVGISSKKDIMRILSSVVAIFVAVGATAPAFAENMPSGSARFASLRCVQFAMVREHHHNPNGWPTDCGAQLPQPKKG